MTTTLREALEAVLNFQISEILERHGGRRAAVCKEWMTIKKRVRAALNAGEGPVPPSTLAATKTSSPSASLRGEPAPMAVTDEMVEAAAKVRHPGGQWAKAVKNPKMKAWVSSQRAHIREVLSAALSVTKPQPDDKQAEIDLCSQLRALSRAEHDDLSIAAEAAAEIERLKALLREHHRWHLDAGTIGLEDGDGGWIAIDNAAEYSDSLMYEKTEQALAGMPADQQQPMPRGGISAWWLEVGIKERRRRRAAEATISKLVEALEAQVRAHKMLCEVAGLDEQAHLDGSARARDLLNSDERDQTTGGIYRQHAGMTLRDWFAGQALVGMLTHPTSEGSCITLAQWAYDYADAMLAARANTDKRGE